MRRRPTDDGFSLVEVLIAMFLLAVLALAVLPLLIGAMRTSVTNRDHVAATAFATAQLAALRADFPLEDATTSCADLAARSGTVIVDPAGSGMTAALLLAVPCPGTYPASLPLTITVAQSGKELTILPSRIRVAAP